MEVQDIKSLEAEYTRLDTLYRKLAQDALNVDDKTSIITQIKSVNQQLAGVLDKMLMAVAQVKQDGSKITEYKDELVRRLRTIRSDYDNLRKNTDQLETLRRIREYEQSKASGSLNWYLLGFFVLCGVLVLFMFIFGRQASFDASAAMPASPTITAPFM